MRKRNAIICVVIITVLIGAWSFLGDPSAPPPVKLSVGFLGYTKGFMGKRMAIIALTNRSDKAVRVWPNFDLEYGAPLSERIGGNDITERVLRPGETVTNLVEVITEPTPARWRLRLKTSWSTPSERFLRRWERYTDAHRWTWYLPQLSGVRQDSAFTTDWFGP